MSLIDTITGINGYTFSILAVLFALTFVSKYGFGTVRLLVRIALGLGMAYFLLIGWETLDYDRDVQHKGKKITFQENKFVQECNLRKLYDHPNDRYHIEGRELSFRYDCWISDSETFLLNHGDEKEYIKIAEVKPISSEKEFMIVDSLTTGSIGLGASFGGNTELIILKDINRSYIILKSDLKYGEIK